MKKTIVALGALAIGLAALTSCSGDGSKTGAQSKNVGGAASKEAPLGHVPNYRFINLDTIGLKYNLAIDFNEQMIRLQNGLADEEKRQQQMVQNKVNALEQRAQAAQNLTDAGAMRAQLESINNEFESVQRQAQQKMAEAAANAEKTIAANSQVLQDSLTNFLREYAEQRGYDAILVNTAAPYYNPALDVTEEVVEGLNARYNKVKK